MEIAVLLALIVINGLFAMSEIALLTARKARLQVLIENGDSAAGAALRLGEDPTRFLSTIQIGITSIGVLNGIVGESALAEPFTQWLELHGLGAPYSVYFATGSVVIVITYFSIVLGELVPKRLGQSHPERLARLVARPIDWLALATKPFVHLLSLSTHGVLRLLRVPQGYSGKVTEEEIHAVLAEGTSAGVIESGEHAMVRNVFRLDDRRIGSLMVPRSEVVCLDLELPPGENLRRIEEAHFARFPLVRGDLDQVLGVVSARQWLLRLLRDESTDAEMPPVEPQLNVPESITGMELLEKFRSSTAHMAFVIDEYGVVQGIVTLHDLIEAITGELQPHDPESSWAVPRPDGSWLLDGYIPVPELKDRLELEAVPEEERGRYHTLSGMLMLLLGRLPRVTDTVEWEQWRFEIVDMDGKAIDKVLATRRPETAGAGAPP
jgi:putative hemolysin